MNALFARHALHAALIVGLLQPGRAVAADFSVSPARLEIAPAGRAAPVTVANQDERPLRMQVRLAEWSQDEAGRDIYRDAGRIKSIPSHVMLAPGESRALDVDIAPPPAARERTYRLFLDEIPNAADRKPGAGNVAVSFALPIFMPPAQPERRAEIQSLALVNGELRIIVSNAGNQHVRIESLTAVSGTFRKEIAGWYLLAGARRAHTLPIPAHVCRNSPRLEIGVRTEAGLLERSFAIEPGMCQR